MNPNNLVKEAVKETFSFPVLFLPIFLLSLFNAILASDIFVGIFGPVASLGITLILLLLFSPLAAGLVILIDRGIQARTDINMVQTMTRVGKKIFLLVGTNAISWIGIFVGFMLFIIPGLYLLIKLIFINQKILLDDERSVEQIFRGSWNLTSGWMIELFTLIALLMFPLLLIQFMVLQFPPQWSATIQTTVGTGFQTWYIVAVTHFFVTLKEKSET